MKKYRIWKSEESSRLLIEIFNRQYFKEIEKEFIFNNYIIENEYMPEYTNTAFLIVIKANN